MKEIMTRRSHRKFLDKAVESEKIERLLRAAMQSPTGHDAQDWEFLVVTDPETKLKISQMSPVSVCAKNAPLLIVMLANLERAVPDTELWKCDLGAACQTVLLQAEHEGMGGVWLAGFPHKARMEYMTELFSLPEHIVPYAVLAIGYKERDKSPIDRYDEAKVHWEKY